MSIGFMVTECAPTCYCTKGFYDYKTTTDWAIEHQPCAVHFVDDSDEQLRLEQVVMFANNIMKIVTGNTYKYSDWIRENYRNIQ